MADTQSPVIPYDLEADGLDWLWGMRGTKWRLVREDFENRDHYDEYAKMLAGNGVNCVITFGCHFRWDFYPERRKLFEAIADAVRVCHKYGIKLIEHHSATFMSTGAVDDVVYEGTRLGDCFQVSAHRDDPAFPTYVGETRVFCANNPTFQAAYRDFIQGYLDAGVDGLMSDDVQWITPYACVCPHCRDKFREESGLEVPPIEDRTFWDNLDSPAFRAFLRFRMKSVGDHHVRLRAMSEARPKRLALAACCANTTSAWNTQTDAGAYDQFIRGCNLGHREITRSEFYAANWMHNGASGKAWSAITGAHGVPNMHCPCPRSREERFAAWAQAMVFGHRFCQTTIRSAYPYRTWREEDAYFDDSLHWEREHAFLFDKPEPIANVAVLFSTQTRDLYGGPEDAYAVDEWLGWGETLYERGALFDVLMDSYLTADALRPFSLLVLPNAACLSDAQAAIIRAYVQGGGAVIATYESSLYDGDGARREDFALADVFGVEYAGALTEIDMPFTFAGDEVAQAVAPGAGGRIPFRGPNALVRTHEGTRVLARQRHSNVFTNYPFVTLNTYGKGRALYFSAKPGVAVCLRKALQRYAPLTTRDWTWQHGFVSGPIEWVDKRDRNALAMIRNAVEMLAGPTTPARLEGAPRGVVFEAHRTRGDRVVLHLLNAMGSTFEDGDIVGADHRIAYPPLEQGFSIMVRRDLAKSRWPTLYSPDLDRPRPLPFEEHETHTRIDVRPQDLHRYSIVCLEP